MSAWIFLRGLTRESAHWGNFPSEFRALVPDCDVALLDLPGNGELHAQRSPTTVAAMVEHARARLRERGKAPPYHLLGLSLGAMVCIDWARRHPQELAAAVLVNTSVRPFSRLRERLRPANYLALARLALLERDAHTRESAILRLISNAGDPDGSIAARWVEIASRRPVSRANALRQLYAAARFRAPIAAPDVRWLVLAGAQDRLVDPACSRRLAQEWNVPIAVHPRAGHDLPLDDGPWVAQQVNAWLRRT